MIETVFVGRDRELAKLLTFLDRALAGQGQVAFVVGDAGSGKTALIKAFTQLAQQDHDDLRIAMGTCNAQGGIGDPYLPFRDVLTSLTGASGDRAAQPASEEGAKRLKDLLIRSAQVLAEFGPDLIGTLVPGTLLIARFGRAVAQKAGLLDELQRRVGRKETVSGSTAIEQSRIFEQYSNVLTALAKEQPLLIILDDLQWADDASVSLLFHLSRRIEHSRLLLIGTYRPDEVMAPRANARHPLEKVLVEIKRYAGDVWVDVGSAAEDTAEGRAFVDLLIDSEPNGLGEDFRRALYQHTGGHALFTVELLRTLQQRGDLLRDAQGRWVAGPALNWQTGTLPARVEGAVSERLGRLEETQRELLRTASVEGVDFTAEVVAQVRQVPARQLYTELSQNLEKRHRLVRERGIIRSGTQRLARFQFVHGLFQQALYDELGSAERQVLHGDVARAIEQCYAEQLDTLSAQLAWHYVLAGEDDRAVEYLMRAGERALAQGAPREAGGFFDQALDLLPSTDQERRWRSLLGRVAVLDLRGEREAQKADVQALLDLAEAMHDDGHKAEAQYRKVKFEVASGDPRATLTAIEEAIQAAKRAGNLELELRVRGHKVVALTRLGEHAAARQTADETLERVQGVTDEAVRAFVLNRVAIHYVESGSLAEAAQLFPQAAQLARRMGDRAEEARLLENLGYTYAQLGLFKLARDTLEQALSLSEAVGDRRARAYGLLNLGIVHRRNNNEPTARRLTEQALEELTTMGDAVGRAECLLSLGYMAERAGDLAAAVQRFTEAREEFRRAGANTWATEALAGMARTALVAGRQNDAEQSAMEVWEYLRAHGGQGMESASQAYLSVANVYAALGDTVASRSAAEAGYHELMARAGEISETEWQQSYLENVEEHRAITEIWERVGR